jgi:AsmA protein
MRKPFIDFDITIQELDINKAYREVALIRSMAPAAKDVFGTLSIDYKFKSDLTKDVKPVMKTMEGGGRIRIHQAKIDGMKIMDEISKQSKKDKINDPTLNDFVMDTEIHGTKLVVKPFALKLSDFDAEIQGVNDVSGTVDYVVKVSMLPFEKIKLPFHITGTYDKPKIALGKAKPVE